MDAHHRKIDLQSPADLTYLLTNIKAAAQQKLDLAIPPSAAPEGEDAYRSKVEELVQEYILQTLTLALPSLTLNGLDPSPTLLRPDTLPESTSPDDNGNYEPYDPRLAEKLRTLYAELDSQSTRVAELRREAPGAAARQYMERLEEGLKWENEADAERIAKSKVLSTTDLDVGDVERNDDVGGIWRRGTQGLVELGKIPGILAKLERAGKAAEVVESM
ncbi:kinetochor protein Mis14/NSL1, partial [Lecanoromycetidae sp. Uapishka_2]